MIETIIVPIVKNKCGNLSDSNNYRPIALVTIISKLFESVIVLKCEMFLDTCPNLFEFKKGHSTDMCIDVLKEFIELYRSRNTRQKMFIRWGISCSTKFRVKNEVKQGGILSPAFFNVYMSNLSVSLNHSGIGGSLGGNLINHLCYADDLCLIALSSSGIQSLLDICDKYATGHQLTYNATKSFTLCFKPKHIKIGLPDFVLGKLVIPVVDKNVNT